MQEISHSQDSDGKSIQLSLTAQRVLALLGVNAEPGPHAIVPLGRPGQLATCGSILWYKIDDK